MAGLTRALARSTYCRRNFCSWMTCCTKKHFLLFSFSLFLSPLSWCSSVCVLEEMVKNLSSVERVISNYWEGLNIKESLTCCSTKFLITISVSATFPETRSILRMFRFQEVIEMSSITDSYLGYLACSWCLLNLNVPMGWGSAGSKLACCLILSPRFITSPAEMHCVQRGYKTQ